MGTPCKGTKPTAREESDRRARKERTRTLRNSSRSKNQFGEAMENYFIFGALISATIGGASDMRTRRIPNWLTYGSLGTALWFRTYLEGWHGLGQGLSGILAGGGVFLFFFLLGGMGAGDVKLMAAVGAWVGVWPSVLIMVYTAFAGFVLAIIYMVFYKRIGQTFSNVAELLRFHLRSGFHSHPEINLQDAEAVCLPYGLAIAIGTLFLFVSTTTFLRG